MRSVGSRQFQFFVNSFNVNFCIFIGSVSCDVRKFLLQNKLGFGAYVVPNFFSLCFIYEQ